MRFSETAEGPLMAHPSKTSNLYIRRFSASSSLNDLSTNRRN